MLKRSSWLLVFVLVLASSVDIRRAEAQQGDSSTDTTIAERHDVISDSQHHYIGKVEIHSGPVDIFADEAWAYTNENRVLAIGNVLFRQGTSQISADRADFDTKTHYGTFYNATGFATIQPPKQPPRPGVAAAPPPMAGQETIVYFFGDTVEKIGPKKYKIVKGGFTTCVQPTPRWNLSADTVILNVQHYTFLRNAILDAKGVPLLYLPVLYYPTNKGDRATGFLLPTYGSSTLRGQSIHNAFFWAIDRSQDATVSYDWFSKAGQGVGTEYRYNFGGGDDGNIRAYMLDQHEVTFQDSNAGTSSLPAAQSYEVHGNMSEMLPYNLRARARVDYFSSFQTMQTFSTNIYAASQSQRSYGGNLIGAWGTYTFNGTFDHTEYFYSQQTSAVTGGWPRLDFTRNERPIGDSPFYFSLGTEYVNLLSDRLDSSSGTLQETNLGFSRFNVAPQIRFPFKKWPWLTVNTTFNFNETEYTRSLDANSNPVDVPLNRQYFTVASQITGPVFSRIWDTPDNGYAEKFKHTIEPNLTVSRTSSINNYNSIIQLESTDQVVGGVTQLTYGVTNRFYAKRRSAVPGQAAQAREIFTVSLQQSYYTDDRAAIVDRQYVTSNLGAPPSNFSPIALDIRAMPSDTFNATAHAEFDSTYWALRTVSANGQYNWNQIIQTAIGWSKKNFIPQLTGFNDPTLLDQAITANTNVHTRDNKYGALYSANYDVLHSTLLQQRITGFYNAQCCGLAFEYQIYHFLSGSISPIPADHRFFLSFTLAGLGNFSPFNGALSGVPR